MITVAIIEDNRVVREIMTEMLNGLPDVDVVFAGTHIDTGSLKAMSPQVILLDIGLQDTDCLAAAERVRDEMTESHVIVMDLVPVHEEIAQFVNVGVAGFILKDATFDDFVSTIRSVAGGTRVLPPRMTGTLFSQIARIAIEKGEADVVEVVHMTKRELEVIARIADGLSNREIAESLEVAPDTVKSHVRNVMEKLALHTRLQIAAYARQQEELA